MAAAPSPPPPSTVPEEVPAIKMILTEKLPPVAKVMIPNEKLHPIVPGSLKAALYKWASDVEEIRREYPICADTKIKGRHLNDPVKLEPTTEFKLANAKVKKGRHSAATEYDRKNLINSGEYQKAAVCDWLAARGWAPIEDASGVQPTEKNRAGQVCTIYEAVPKDSPPHLWRDVLATHFYFSHQWQSITPPPPPSPEVKSESKEKDDSGGATPLKAADILPKGKITYVTDARCTACGLNGHYDPCTHILQPLVPCMCGLAVYCTDYERQQDEHRHRHHKNAILRCTRERVESVRIEGRRMNGSVPGPQHVDGLFAMLEAIPPSEVVPAATADKIWFHLPHPKCLSWEWRETTGWEPPIVPLAVKPDGKLATNLLPFGLRLVEVTPDGTRARCLRPDGMAVTVNVSRAGSDCAPFLVPTFKDGIIYYDNAQQLWDWIFTDAFDGMHGHILADESQRLESGDCVVLKLIFSRSSAHKLPLRCKKVTPEVLEAMMKGTPCSVVLPPPIPTHELKNKTQEVIARLLRAAVGAETVIPPARVFKETDNVTV